MRTFGLIAGVLLFLTLPLSTTDSGTMPDGKSLAEVLSPTSPVEAAAPARQSLDAAYEIPVLMYHDLGTPAAGLTVTPDMFRKQVDLLADAGYQGVSIDAVLLALRGEPVRLPEKGVVLTFDDAYVDVYRVAYPVLKKRGFKATLFVITGLVGERGYADWEQVREMASDGWTIGSHTVYHQDLRLLNGRRLEDEIVSARKTLREKTGQSVLSFCYPAGQYNDAVIEAVKSAGYFGAVTTEPGVVTVTSAPFTLKRVRIDGRDGIEVFRAKLSMP